MLFRSKLKAVLEDIGWCGKVPIVRVLDSFTRFMGRATKTSKAEVFWDILNFSWTVTSITGFDKVLNENQVRYLSKLGDYVRIIERMPMLLKKAGETKITIEQVIT